MILLDHLETNITLACQNKCVACNHFIALQKPRMIDPFVIQRDLSTFGKITHCKSYAVLGGEPTLHPQLTTILKIVKDSNITDCVELWTNGQSLGRVEDRAWKFVNKLIVTAYPNKGASREEAERLCRSNNMELEWRPFTEFAALIRSVPVEPNAEGCFYGSYCHVVDEGYFYRCCVAPFLPEALLGLPKGTDGISLDGLTEEGLLRYMKQTPLSCGACCGSNAPRIPWSEYKEDWIKESSV